MEDTIESTSDDVRDKTCMYCKKRGMPYLNVMNCKMKIKNFYFDGDNKENNI